MAHTLGVLMIYVLAYLVLWWIAMNLKAIGGFLKDAVFVVGAILLGGLIGLGAMNTMDDIRGRHRRD